MKGLGFSFLIAFLLLLILGRPQSHLRRDLSARQAQEEEMAPQEEEAMEEGQEVRVRYRASDAEESEILDIKWLKKAAKTAIDRGMPYFNVLEQSMIEDPKHPVMEGTIELSKDPMGAEYDGHAITELTLSPEFSE